MNILELYKVFQEHPNVVTDSRAIKPGCLFFALKGDRFDGNAYAEEALVKGAAHAVIDNPRYATDERCILVDDVLNALQQLATHHRRQFYIPIIGITGSNGKTTTKELVSTVLASQYPTHFTKGNLNNHIGVPLTLLSMDSSAEIAIIEMGANHQGEIDALCRIAEPTHGLITNIGKAHLEGFGGIEGVKKGKSEMYRFLAERRGLAFVNWDDEVLKSLLPRELRCIKYTMNDKPDPTHVPVEGKLVGTEPFLTAEFLNENGQAVTVQSNLVGHYNFYNILTAITLGKYFKVPSQRIKAAIEAYMPDNSRSQMVKKEGFSIILDAYNANPSSMKVALDNLSRQSVARKVAILGDMFELGDDSLKEHQQLLNYGHGLGIEIVACGGLFSQAVLPDGSLHFENTSALKTWFDGMNFEGAVVLIKGSRGMKMESILE